MIGKTAVHMKPGETGFWAEILFTAPAKRTPPAGLVQPRHAHPVTDLQAGDPGAQGFNHPHNLVPWRDWQGRGVDFPFDNVQVRVADTAYPHMEAHLARPCQDFIDSSQLQRGFFGRALLKQAHRPVHI
jgi:hypothetical protein